MADPKGKPKTDAADASSNRFVSDGSEFTFNGMSAEDFLKHPDTKAAVAKANAAKGPAAPPAHAPKK
jgi:hypothetical protein